MKIIYEKMLTLLGAIPELQWIDLDKGQLEGYDMRPAVNFPCALLRIELPQCADEGEKKQRCTCRITVRVAHDFMGDTSAITPLINRQGSLAYFDTAEKVFKALQGYYDTEIDQLTRVSSFQEGRPDGIVVMQTVFETEFDDLTATA